jgi:hypothetical protein
MLIFLTIALALFLAARSTFDRYSGPKTFEFKHFPFAVWVCGGMNNIEFLSWTADNRVAARKNFLTIFTRVLFAFSALWWIRYPDWRNEVGLLWLLVPIVWFYRYLLHDEFLPKQFRAIAATVFVAVVVPHIFFDVYPMVMTRMDVVVYWFLYAILVIASVESWLESLGTREGRRRHFEMFDSLFGN